MFERLEKVFSSGDSTLVARPPGAPAVVSDATAEWARAQGLALQPSPNGKGFSVTGQVASKPWRLEVGRSSRDYIHGDELRACGEVGVNEDAAVLVMNRPLKDALEKRAYQMYTDTLP